MDEAEAEEDDEVLAVEPAALVVPEERRLAMLRQATAVIAARRGTGMETRNVSM